MALHSHRFGKLERRIMTFLWKRDEASVRDVEHELSKTHRVAYTTVMTVMNRLVEKKLLKRRAHGRAFLYAPRQTKDETARKVSESMIRSLVDDFGSVGVSQFINALDDVDDSLVAKLRKALNDPSR